MIRGCSYTDNEGRITTCENNKGGLCRAGAVLTSACVGAHPADCPMIMGKGGAGDGDK